MAQSDDTTCPVCGATAEDAQRIRGALAPQTILNGKYLTNLFTNSLDAYVSCAFVNHVYLNLEYSSIAVY